ncbi:hypothetical protein HJC10_46610, partial [Corallococcus exiguus]|nr:hypothetical protein [Corallococcus exiguus]
AQEDELPLPIQVEDVDDPQPGLARASAILPRQKETAAGKAAQDPGEEQDEGENDHEGNDVLGCPGSFYSKLRQHGGLSSVVARPGTGHLSWLF